jgi:hypothetical protein
LQRANHFQTAGLTNVGGAQAHSFGPEFVIREAVRTHNAKGGELTVQTLDFVGSRCFQIKHQRVGAVPRDRGANLLVGVGPTNGVKVAAKSGYESLTGLRVVLIQNYRK